MFHDKRAVECARLLAAECDASDPSIGLYGEGLTIALLSACFQGRPKKRTQDYRSHNSISFCSSTSISIHPFLFSSLPVWSTCHPRNLRGCSRRLQECPASLSTEHPDRQSAGATADERREPFHGGSGNRFCRSEPLHADVQEGHWSYTTRVASEPDRALARGCESMFFTPAVDFVCAIVFSPMLRMIVMIAIAQ